mmetsp:Transcript_119242/g.315208  ORF Transcript_119242/g.315208 Transcript_119242/m.315208 type:complete len:206 (+) Transcript_119242:186-803(+)
MPPSVPLHRGFSTSTRKCKQRSQKSWSGQASLANMYSKNVHLPGPDSTRSLLQRREAGALPFAGTGLRTTTPSLTVQHMQLHHEQDVQWICSARREMSTDMPELPQYRSSSANSQSRARRYRLKLRRPPRTETGRDAALPPEPTAAGERGCRAAQSGRAARRCTDRPRRTRCRSRSRRRRCPGGPVALPATPGPSPCPRSCPSLP